MTQDALIPNWARDRRTFMQMNVGLGVGLAALLVGVALIAPTVIRNVVDTLVSPFLLIGLGAALVGVSGIRRVVLGPAHKQEVRPGVLLAAYVLAALPLGVAALTLGGLVILALVLKWQPRFDLVQSFVLLMVGFIVFSMTVKTVLNAQMLLRQWLGR